MQDSSSSLPTFSTSTFYYLLGLSVFISCFGLFIPIMEVDASQYASMSLELWQSHSLLQLTDLGEAYLDKPPLLFWLAGLSIHILGNSSFAFKLPSFLFAWGSVYALYRFTIIYYQISIARLSALVYACSVTFLLFTNDIRTDTLMIALVVFAVWQLGEFLQENKVFSLFLATGFIALAMLAKGPIGLVVPCLAVGPNILLKRQWKSFIRWEIIFIPLILLLILSPMLIGLHQQWGMHGLSFFFWEQSFGRITGENVWENEASYFYFLHNIVWAVLPFTLFFLNSLVQVLVNWRKQVEYISFFGLLLPFLALSLSHYKLPHYIYVTVPFASILIAKSIHTWINETHKPFDLVAYWLQLTLITSLLIAPILIFFAFPASMLTYFTYLLGIIAILSAFYLLQFGKKAIILVSFGAFLLGAFIVNSHAYPALLKYQGSSEAAFYIKEHDIPQDQLYQRNIWWRGFHYYSGGNVPAFQKNSLASHNAYVLTNEDGYSSLISMHQTELLKRFDHFNVTRLSLDFLNPKTRKSKVQSLYLVKIYPSD